MQKDALRRQLELLFKNPNERVMDQFIGMVRCEVRGMPVCPKCQSLEIVKMGFTPRRTGDEQQYRCSNCHHIYTNISIKTGELRGKYPKCKVCGGAVKRSGFWKWVLKNGQKKRLQRYECTNPTCRSFFSQGPAEIVQPWGCWGFLQMGDISRWNSTAIGVWDRVRSTQIPPWHLR